MSKELRTDQMEALGKLTAALGEAERCQYVAACATGKTLVCQRVSEEMVPEGLTVVAVPTIALLSQILHNWVEDAAPGSEFTYLAICSDPEVEASASGLSSDDEVVEEEHFRQELNGAVCIGLDDIKRHLKEMATAGRRVAFSTHASIGRLGEALRDLGMEAGLLIVDEAHRAAAVHRDAEAGEGALLGEVVTETFPAARRLFATATPRIISSTDKGGKGGGVDEEVAYSMDDDPDGPFGAVAYRLSFAEAINLGLLVPYDVVVQVTDSAETAKMVAERRLLDVGGETLPADRFARYAGVVRAAHEHDLKRVLTFHEKVDHAEAFASEVGVVAEWCYPGEDVRADSVSAKHATDERNAKFHAFAPEAFPAPAGRAQVSPAQRSYLSNVRICTEGIDIRAIDGVAFVDPRQSVVDIAQAVGRAMRRWPGKESGVVILPVVVPPGIDVDEYMAVGGWKVVWSTLDALRAVDDRLQDLLTTALVSRTKLDGPTGPVGQPMCTGCGNILLRSDSTCPWCDPVRPSGPESAGQESESGGTGQPGGEDGWDGPDDGSEGGGRDTVCGGTGRDDPTGLRVENPPGDGRPTEPPPRPTEPRIVISCSAADVLSTLSLRVLEHSVASFEVRARACGEWMEAHGKMPSGMSKDPVEQRHGRFLDYCRMAERGGHGAGAFTPERRALLDRYVPGWRGTDPDEAFEANARACGEWAEAHGKMPSGTSKDPVERRHGWFLNHCRGAERGKGRGAGAFTPERRALLDRYAPGWYVDRDGAFEANARACGEWATAHGKLPSKASKDPVEQRHGRFLDYCRMAERGGEGAGAFTPERRALLDRYVPGWTGTDPDEDFRLKAVACGEWAEAHGKIPSKGSKDPDERRLGKSLDRWRKAARGGKGATAFAPERRALLDRYVPGWRGTDPEEAFEANARACGEWAEAHGKLPSSGSKDPVERRHGWFLAKCRGAARGGKGASVFTPKRRALLDRYVPGWDAPGSRRGRAA